MKGSRNFWIFLFIIVSALAGTAMAGYFDLPKLPPPEQYGNILINRSAENSGVKPVTFSHWSHRMKYTCRVCHLELEFSMQLNTTAITEKANQEGKYCGACHDGKVAFGHTKENCDKCHNGDISYGKEKFKKLAHFPMTPYGNRIDWVAAFKEGLIKPKDTIVGNYHPMPFDKTLHLEPEFGVPPAVFPHKSHTQWLDCANCHPDIFNIKQKTTKQFSMMESLHLQFCGTCHLRTAFPLDDCKRCHAH
jgi:c(7)-type cytochrome triheme protein